MDFPRLCACAVTCLLACTPKTLTLLHTTDLHANVAAWDYLTATPDPQRGLAKAAALIRQKRTPCTLVIDTGDAIQGAPLGHEPMAAAMNAAGYDAMALGNHDFNFGQGVLKKFIADAKFPVLAGNVTGFNAFVIRDVCGVKVGILGMVTPKVAEWEKPEHIEGLKFYSALDTAKAQVPNMKAAGAQVVVIAIHEGPEGGLPQENEVSAIAREVPGVDVILSGHTHAKIPKLVVNGVIISQPHRWGSHVGETTIVWRGGVQAKDSRILPVEEMQEDEQVMAAVAPQHRKTKAAMDAAIAVSNGEFEGGERARFTDSALADIINAAQTEAAAAAGFPVQASGAAIFTDRGRLPKGVVSLRDVYSVYPYDNTLWVLQLTRQQLKDALEHDARYFKTLSVAPPKPEDVRAPGNLDWDLYSGVKYTVDLRKPEGQRVTLEAPETLAVAMNNYRASGAEGYDMLKGAKVLWRSQESIREMLVAYLKAHTPLAPTVTRNFTLLPDLYGAYFSGLK